MGTPTDPPAAPDDVSFDELYRRDVRALVALAYGLSGSRSAAEELVQEAFLAAHRRWHRLVQYDDPSAWLRRVVANRSVSVIRRRAAEARALVRVRGQRVLPDVLPERDEALWRAVRALPARQAQAVALRYVDDRSVVEIAAILGCAEGTVKAHLHKARQSLARSLTPGRDPGSGADPSPGGEPRSGGEPDAELQHERQPEHQEEQR